MKTIPIRWLSLLFIVLPILASADSPILVPAWHTPAVLQQAEASHYSDYVVQQHCRLPY